MDKFIWSQAELLVLGPYLVGANKLLEVLEVARLLVDFKYSSSLSTITSGLSLALYVRQRLINVYLK